MTQQTTASAVEYIDPPNTLRQKVGRRFSGVDAATLAKAETALKSLSSQFGEWLRDELDKLETARATVRLQGPQPGPMEQLYLRAHDLKGLGATYEYPLITRIAGSLCTLMDGPGGRTATPQALLDAHIDAIRAVVRDEIRDPDHAVGRALAEALEHSVADHMAEAKGSSTAP